MPALMAVEGDRIQDVYYLDPAQLADSTFLQPMMNVSTSEIVVVRLKAQKDYDTVAKALKKRADDVIRMFSTYLPDQYELAKNYQIVRKGDYVLFSISREQQQVAKVFEGFFK